jgi:hypothetical protein
METNGLKKYRNHGYLRIEENNGREFAVGSGENALTGIWAYVLRGGKRLQGGR